jgi:hypothetical protein
VLITASDDLRPNADTRRKLKSRLQAAIFIVDGILIALCLQQSLRQLNAYMGRFAALSMSNSYDARPEHFWRRVDETWARSSSTSFGKMPRMTDV